jgi:hypothetical protein
MARIAMSLTALSATTAAAMAGAIACTSAPDLPPAIGDCDASGNVMCTTPGVVGGGTSAPEGGGIFGSDGAIFDDDAASGCGIGAALNPANPECVTCLAQSCCAAASACAADVSCQFIVQNCTGCASAQSACAGTCAFTQESVLVTTTTAFDDLSACLTQTCLPQCPPLNVFQVVVDP